MAVNNLTKFAKTLDKGDEGSGAVYLAGLSTLPLLGINLFSGLRYGVIAGVHTLV